MLPLPVEDKFVIYLCICAVIGIGQGITEILLFSLCSEIGAHAQTNLLIGQDSVGIIMAAFGFFLEIVLHPTHLPFDKNIFNALVMLGF